MTRLHSLGIAGCVAIMGLIVALGPYSHSGMFLPDQGASWYYWKLPDPTFWTRFWAWSLYALHQLGLWWMIWWAQSRRIGYSRGLHPINVLAIGFNALFVLLHILQTRLSYDGLAQDVSVWSSQFSVIFMLVFILIMENDRRGLLFGRKVNFLREPGAFLRRYHGYYFAWAIVYTFWFHPIEDNLGHLLGTLYILLLLLQGSLFFTRFHRDKVWTGLLEVFVLFHGAMVAYITQTAGSWKMFGFGFFGLFIVTQMHGMGFSRGARWGFVLLYLGGVFAAYRGTDEDPAEVLRIPLAEYALVFVVAGLIMLGLRAWRRKAFE